MRARDDQIDSVSQLVVEVKFKLHFVGKSEHENLKLVKDVHFEGRPVDRHRFGLGDHHAIDD